MNQSNTPAEVGCNEGLGGAAPEQRKDLPFSTIQMQECHDARIERVVDSLQRIKAEYEDDEASKKLDGLLWAAISYAATIPAAARLVDPRTWQHLLVYSTAAAQATARVPLTDEQIEALFKGVDSEDKGRFAIVRGFARAIEAAHGIKPHNAEFSRQAGLPAQVGCNARLGGTFGD